MPSNHEVKPGSGQVWFEDGIVPSLLTSDGTRVTVTGSGISMAVATLKNGQAQPLNGSRTLVIHVRGRLRATVSGFLTGSNVRVWIFSTPVNAAKLLVLSDTKARADFVLPKSIRPGNHTIVASGMTADGKAVTLRIGLRVLPLPAHSAGASAAGWPWWFVIPAAIIIVFFIFMLWRRRRHEDEEEELA